MIAHASLQRLRQPWREPIIVVYRHGHSALRDFVS